MTVPNKANPKCPECNGAMVKNGKVWRGRNWCQKWICNQAPPDGCGKVVFTVIQEP